MLIVALVLAVIGLAALVTAVVTSNELVAWVCIAASVLGVILLIIDAIRERQSRDGCRWTPRTGREQWLPPRRPSMRPTRISTPSIPTTPGRSTFADEPARRRRRQCADTD